MPRGSSDKWVVEYSPALLFKWHGHAHLHILRTAEHSDCSPNAIFYVTKYNFKNEPSLRVDVRQEDTYATLFNARVVSSEEAVARIFSFDFHGSSSTFEYLSVQPPESRSAPLIDGRQVQVPDVEKYFLRPSSLDRLTILSFFSLYDISADKDTNEDRQRHLPDDALACLHRTRPPLTLTSPDWEDTNLNDLNYLRSAPMLPAPNLPAARALNCRLRNEPRIVILPKLGLSTNSETLAYAFLLLHGCWRSDSEMQAGQDSWAAALRYHGLSPPDVPDIFTYSCRLFQYMLTSLRYSPTDLAAAFTRLPADITPFMTTLRDTCGPHLRAILDQVAELLTSQQPIPSHVPLDGPLRSEDARHYITCDFSPAVVDDARTLLRQLRGTLSSDQAYVFQKVEDALNANFIFTFFISGKAGTGKSFLITCLKSLFTSRSIPFVAAASTGIASTLIGGRTVHSTFGLFTTSDDQTLCSLDVSRPRGFAISQAQVLIIDEVTMISRSVMNALDTGLRRLAGQSNRGDPSLPFGGKSVLLLGDLAQVPAVVRTHDDFSESAEQFFASSPYNSFTRYSLNQVMRQHPDELAFLALLDDVRNTSQALSTESLALLRSRFLPGDLACTVDAIDAFVGHDDPGGMVITFTNARADYYNRLILDRRGAAPITFAAHFYVRHANSFLHDLRDDRPPPREPHFLATALATDAEIRLFVGAFKRRQFNTIVPFSLTLAVGARVMLLQNLDIQLGLINGARGTVTAYDLALDAILVHFDCQSADAPPTVITRTETVHYPLARGDTIFMFQFPLKTCWAVTAHKSQGQSLQRVAIDISDHAFAHGSLYVALSRVRFLQSILLFGLDDFPVDGPSFHVNPYIRLQEHLPAIND